MPVKSRLIKAKKRPAVKAAVSPAVKHAVQSKTGARGKALGTSAAVRRLREKFLLAITSLPTAAGREEQVIAAIEGWVEARRDRLVLSRDRSGNLTIAQHGFLAACAKGARPVMFTAHLDHPAFVVTAVRSKGMGRGKKSIELDLEFRGGVHDPYFVGAQLEVFDPNFRRSTLAKIVSLDSTIELPSKPFKTVVAKLVDPAAAKHVAAGSVARWKFADASVRDGIAHTHACDDLAAVAAALLAFDVISRSASCAHVALLFTRSEEIGFIGAIGAARDGTVPRGTRLVCLENSRSFPHDSPIGAGPIVRVGDRLSVFTPELTNRIGDLAAAHAKETPSFRFQRKLMPGGACEATAFASFGLCSTCLCLPLGNYHNMQEIDEVLAGSAKGRVGREFISVADFHWLIELLVAIAHRLDEPALASAHKQLMETLWARHAHLVGGGG